MTRYRFLHTLARLSEGQTVARIRMNRALAAETITGLVVDIGGGRGPDYFSYLQGADAARIEPLDLSISGIDLEQEALPYTSETVDTVLMCNILEHIFNHMHLLREARRVLRQGGQLIGFVPFWVGYHPDPHDYFRYTHEALQRLLYDAGFSHIRITSVGGGPILANFNTLMLSFPRLLRPLLYPFVAAADTLFLALRPKSRERNPLGYLFVAS